MRVDIRRRKKLRLKCPKCGDVFGSLGPEVNLGPTRCCNCSAKQSQWSTFYDFFVGEERLDLKVDRVYERFWIPKAKGLGKGSKRVHGRWTPVKTEGRGFEAYLSCPVCGGVNNLTDCHINSQGACECFHCGLCGADLYLSLKDWAPYHGLEPGAMPKFVTSHGRAYSFEEMEGEDADDYGEEDDDDESEQSR